MKLLTSLLFLLCLAQHAAALSPRLNYGPAVRRSYEQLNNAEAEERSLICKPDAVLLACKALGAQATTFCSSYLHIPTSTVVVSTSTPTTTTVIATATSTSTTTTTTSTTDVESATVITSTTITAGPPDKRAIPKSASFSIPSILSKFLATEISSACLCLSILTPKVTSTSTVPTLVTQTSTTTTITIGTSTLIYTTTTSATSTSTYTSVLPFVCSPGGAPCTFNEAGAASCCSGACGGYPGPPYTCCHVAPGGGFTCP